MKLNLRRIAALVALLVIPLTIGCGRSSGPERVAVRGAILFNNQMLKSGRITFIPTDGTKGPVSVTTVSDGFYDFPRRNGPVVGKHKVRIESIVDPGFELDDEAAYAKAASQPTGQPAIPRQPIPAQYNDQTTLTATVSPDGETKLDFSL